VAYLAPDELDALLAAPDPATWTGRRDHAMLVLLAQTGLRVSELTHLVGASAQLGRGAHVRCHGKGRKERSTPLTAQTVAVLSAWIKERAGGLSAPLFATSTGRQLSPDAVQWLVAKYATAAARTCPSIAKKRVSPHVLRHTCAMNFVRAGVDVAVIALWLGHESIQTVMIYVHADMALKEQALARTTPFNTKPGRYRPPDALLAFLEAL
jgi:site-specific recombinase XerD